MVVYAFDRAQRAAHRLHIDGMWRDAADVVITDLRPQHPEGFKVWTDEVLASERLARM